MGQRLIDDNGVIDIVDDNGVACFVDDDGNFTCDESIPIRTKPGKGPKVRIQGHLQDPNSWRF